MTDKEKGLYERTTDILSKDTKGMNLVDIIAELVGIVEKQDEMMKLFIMEEK